MKKFFHRYKYLFVLLLFSLIVHLPWLSLNIFSYSDWLFQFKETLQEALILSSWVSGIGLGQVDILLWRAPLNLLLGGFGFFGHSLNIADKLLVFWPIILLPGITSFFLIKKLVGSPLSAFIGAFVFSFNSFFLAINSQGHILLTVSFAIATAAILFFMKSLEDKSLQSALITILLLFFTGAYDFRVLYITLLLLALYWLYLFVVNGKTMVKIPLLILAGITMLNAFWFLPSVAGSSFLSNDVLSRDLFGNKFWSLEAAMSLHHPFWSGEKTEWFKKNETPIYYWATPLLAFLGLAIHRRNKKLVFFGLIAVTGILLTKQVDQPFGNLYIWLFENIPGFSAFREASKFYFLILLSYSVLIGALFKWLLQYERKIFRHSFAVYSLGAIVISLSLWNTKPLITGEIGTMFVPRQIPQDYVVLKDFILEQPGFFRTYWAPRDSRWGIYTNNHPKISGVDVVQKEWSELADYKSQPREWPAGEKIVDLLTKPYADNLFDQSSIKYVIVPLQDKENDDDFFVHYGKDRQFYIDTLDKVEFLQRIDIGTKELVVYENKNYKPSIMAQSNLVGLENFYDLSNSSNFLSQIGKKNSSYHTDGKNLAYGSKLKSMYKIPHLKLQESGLSIGDNIDLKQGTPAKLYKNSNSSLLGYQATKTGIQFFTKPQPSASLNGKSLDFGALVNNQPLERIALESSQRYFLKLDDSALPISEGPAKNIGRTNSYKKLELHKAAQNLIPNQSFEDGLWTQEVGNCNKRDKNSKLGISLNSEHLTAGKNSLQLEATRHIACTGIKLNITAVGRHLLSFDYQSPNSKQAGYYLQFNNKSKTAIHDRLAIHQPNQWQTFTKSVAVPEGITEATLIIYAYESDGQANNIVRYDNFNLSKTEFVKAVNLPVQKDSYKAVDVDLINGQNNFELKSADYNGLNLINNPSFEEGLWSNKVGDCHNYDGNPKIGMKQAASSGADGGQSLQLEATRHTACTSTAAGIKDIGDHLLSFNFQGKGAKQAGYYLQFNDSKKTVITERLSIKQQDTWQEFKKKIVVPAGATNANLAVYAYESDGRANNIVLYDNFKFIKIPDLDNTYYLLTEENNQLQLPQQISYSAESPTKKIVDVKGADKPFTLTFADSFHPGWKLYLSPIAGSSDCRTVRVLEADKEKTQSGTIECESKQRLSVREDLSYLRQKPVFDDRHIKLNGYANGWVVDPQYVKANYSKEYYRENPDGSIDMNLAVYFKPQSYFYIGLAISALTLLGCVSYLAYSYLGKKRRRPEIKPK